MVLFRRTFMFVSFTKSFIIYIVLSYFIILDFNYVLKMFTVIKLFLTLLPLCRKMCDYFFLFLNKSTDLLKYISSASVTFMRKCSQLFVYSKRQYVLKTLIAADINVLGGTWFWDYQIFHTAATVFSLSLCRKIRWK